MRRAAATLLALALLSAACTGGNGGEASPATTTPPPTPGVGSPTPGSSPTSEPAGALLTVGGVASLAPTADRPDQLGCALRFRGLPDGPVEVRIETLGRGAGADLTVRVGEQWDDGEVSDADGANQILVFQTIRRPAGDYGCRVLQATGPQGPMRVGGEVTTLDSVAVMTQQVADFIADFPRAVREDDRDFLLATLHPAVLELYGQEACAAMLADGFADPSFALGLLRVRGPKDYTYDADGTSTTIADTWELNVEASSDAGSGEAWVHYTQIGEQLTWFADCGDPLT